MKILHSKGLKNGKLHLLVEVSAHESLISIDQHKHYQLGGQVDDVVGGHVIAEMKPVYWCSVTQKWEDA
jgi:hypothetical protein